MSTDGGSAAASHGADGAAAAFPSSTSASPGRARAHSRAQLTAPLLTDPRPRGATQFRLVLTIVRGRALTSMDIGGTSDPYCCVHVDGVEVGRTAWQGRTLDPEWGDRVVVKIPPGVSGLEIRVWDHDMVGHDDDMGFCTLGLRDMVANNGKNWWVPLMSESLDVGGGGDILVRVDFDEAAARRSASAPELWPTYLGGAPADGDQGEGMDKGKGKGKSKGAGKDKKRGGTRAGDGSDSGGRSDAGGAGGLADVTAAELEVHAALQAFTPQVPEPVLTVLSPVLASTHVGTHAPLHLGTLLLTPVRLLFVAKAASAGRHGGGVGADAAAAHMGDTPLRPVHSIPLPDISSIFPFDDEDAFGRQARAIAVLTVGGGHSRFIVQPPPEAADAGLAASKRGTGTDGRKDSSADDAGVSAGFVATKHAVGRLIASVVWFVAERLTPQTLALGYSRARAAVAATMQDPPSGEARPAPAGSPVASTDDWVMVTDSPSPSASSPARELSAPTAAVDDSEPLGSGWDAYSAVSEFARQGVTTHRRGPSGSGADSASGSGSGPWVLSHVNESYGVCATYPHVVAVPQAISDSDVRLASKFRTKQRFPTLSWRHPTNGACICRSSQPRTGFMGKSSEGDRAFLQAVRKVALRTMRDLTRSGPRRGGGGSNAALAPPPPSSSLSLTADADAGAAAAAGSRAVAGVGAEGDATSRATKVYVLDCRPPVNARGNAFRGGGASVAENYVDNSDDDGSSSDGEAGDDGREGRGGDGRREGRASGGRLSESMTPLAGEGSVARALYAVTSSAHRLKRAARRARWSPRVSTTAAPTPEEHAALLTDFAAVEGRRTGAADAVREATAGAADAVREATAGAADGGGVGSDDVAVTVARDEDDEAGGGGGGGGGDGGGDGGGGNDGNDSGTNSHRPKRLPPARASKPDTSPASALGTTTASGAGAAQTPWVEVEFLGIGNIHTMRRSLRAMREARDGADTAFHAAVASSGWLAHVTLVVRGAVRAAHIVASGCPVLVHCSDGWDRTAQVTSLAQLLMDPYYRTVDGFATLVEKDWCSFGHMFGRRCSAVAVARHRCSSGHKVANGFDATHWHEQSPIFLQWLDCVWQVLRQRPNEFGFNEMFLRCVASHVSSGFFGNFQYDCEQQRVERRIPQTTRSLWGYLGDARRRRWFLNPDFIGVSGRHTVRRVRGIELKRISVWSGLYLAAGPIAVPASGAFDELAATGGAEAATGGGSGSSSAIGKRSGDAAKDAAALEREVARLRAGEADWQRRLEHASAEAADLRRRLMLADAGVQRPLLEHRASAPLLPKVHRHRDRVDCLSKCAIQ